jgi:hypothetical protein
VRRGTLGGCFVLLVFLLCLYPSLGVAFYDYQGDGFGVNVLGLVGVDSSVNRNPATSELYTSDTDLLWSGDLRLLVEGWAGEGLGAELNLLEVIARKDSSLWANQNLPGVERSSLFSWEQHDSVNSLATLQVDRFYLSWADQDLELTAGRQSVNLATTFYFTPNDFFAPFAAHTFYRVYKPGVDGLRLEKRLANLSQLTLLAILGFEEDQESDNGWSRRPDWSRSSVVTRVALPFRDMEVGLLVGSVRVHRIFGASLQGELFSWLGVRAEGHYADPEEEGGRSGLEASLGLEHRFPNSLDLRMEYFYNGRGYKEMGDADYWQTAGGSGYSGRNYTALGMNYQFSPLLVGELLVMRNWSDHSHLLSLHAVYSLSDESELTVSCTLPDGKEAEENRSGSELGNLPRSLSLTYRRYF